MIINTQGENMYQIDYGLKWSCKVMNKLKDNIHIGKKDADCV